MPGGFLIARHTFIDVGPPNDFYEIISVRGTSTGTAVERVTLTPAGDACIQRPTVEVAVSSIPDPVGVLLEGCNPCAIPDKSLRKELKRRKHGLVFSGAEISMHVQCGRKERIIRADILDRDMFDPKAATPSTRPGRCGCSRGWTRHSRARFWTGLCFPLRLNQPKPQH